MGVGLPRGGFEGASETRAPSGLLQGDPRRLEGAPVASNKRPKQPSNGDQDDSIKFNRKPGEVVLSLSWTVFGINSKQFQMFSAGNLGSKQQTCSPGAK
ncbi:hypothetical protein HWI79_295 [Cryptosporidium felis]|nr:hypothetical protein HWI79_295 [Cryptosporidium felis]